jgi:hypothetical protein
MMGLEPTTFCMASRRSSQLSYIRVACPSIARLSGDRVQRLVHQAVGELVLGSANCRVGDAADFTP